MPDLLTHVLVAFTVATLLSIRYRRISPAIVTTAMVGAVLPDLNRLELVLPSYVVVWGVLDVYKFLRVYPLPELTALPFSWNLMHALPAVVLVSVLVSMFVTPEYRRLVLLLLLLGGVSHLSLDLLLVSPGSPSFPVLAPFSGFEPQTPGLYSSRDPWLAAVTIVLAGLARGAKYRYQEELQRN